jgi:hypothetical protein
MKQKRLRDHHFTEITDCRSNTVRIHEEERLRLNYVVKAEMQPQYTYDCKLKKIREMLLTTLEHNQHDVIDVI